MRWKRGWLANNAREEGRRKTRLAEQKTKECSQADTRALPSTLNNRGCRVYEKKKNGVAAVSSQRGTGAGCASEKVNGS